MSSLKMTFSLASLVLILGLVFVAAPAMAQEERTALEAGAIVHTVLVLSLPQTRLEELMEQPDTAAMPVGDIGTGGLPDLEEQLLSGVTIVLAAPSNRARAGDVRLTRMVICHCQ